jgi:hypothetical protein
MNDKKTCISCGMPLEKDADFPLGDRSKDWCVHCARPDGSLQSYGERRAGSADFLVRTQGLDPAAAFATAADLMARFPAWSQRV